MAPSVKLKRIALSDLKSESVFQSAFWAEVKKGSWQSHAFFYEIGTHSGTVLILTRRIFLSYSLAYSPFGLYPEITSEEFSAFAAAVRAELPSHVFTLRLDLPWGSAPLEGRNIMTCRESVQPEGTVRVTLSSDFSLKQRARRNLKKEEGVSVHEWNGSSEEFSSWFTTYKVTGLRDHFTTRPESYVRAVLDIKDPEVKPILYIATYDDLIIGGILTLRGRYEEIYLYGSSVKATGSVSCGYSLQNYAMCKAREAGVKVYDLFGIPSREGGSHLEKLEVFKTSFGGEKVYRAPSTDYIYNPVIAFFYRCAENYRYRQRRSKI